MCLPLLLAAIPAIAGASGTIGTIATVASAGLAAAGAIQQGNAQAAAAEQQATQARIQAELQGRQANMDQQAAQYKENQKGQQLTQLRGQQVASVGSSGFALTGSPSDVVIDSQQKGQMDIAAIQYGADVQSSNLRFGQQISNNNAISSDDAADSYRTAGYLNALKPIIGLGSTKLGGSF